MNDETDRIAFVKTIFGRRTQHVLRRIATAFYRTEQAYQDFLFDDKDRKAILHRELRKFNLEGHVINSTPISYKQARLIYEAIVEKKYFPNNICDKDLPLFPQKIETSPILNGM